MTPSEVAPTIDCDASVGMRMLPSATDETHTPPSLTETPIAHTCMHAHTHTHAHAHTYTQNKITVTE